MCVRVCARDASRESERVLLPPVAKVLAAHGSDHTDGRPPGVPLRKHHNTTGVTPTSTQRHWLTGSLALIRPGVTRTCAAASWS